SSGMSEPKPDQQQQPVEPSAPPATGSNQGNEKPQQQQQHPPPRSNTPVDYQSLLDSKPTFDSRNRQLRLASKANRPERLALCVDASPEFAVKTFRMRNGETVSLLDLTLKCFHLLAQNKLRLGGKHQVSLVGMRGNRISVLEPFTDDAAKLAKAAASQGLRDLLQQPAGDEADFSLDCLLEYARGQLCPNRLLVDNSLPSSSGSQPSLLRIVLLCCRSKSPPHISKRLLEPLLAEPDLFFDILYVHEPPAEDNRAEEIFKRLCCLESEHSRSYIHEVLNNPTAFFNQAATFLAHPLQRPPQSDANYRLQRPPPTPPQEPVAGLLPTATLSQQPDNAD
ncbi:hypothetical protein BOX15_Mlig028105g1, partial [Macrostomum lignano]